MKLVIDLTPVRRSRDLRRLVGGQLLTTLGGQFTAVAVPFQVYALTRSSLDVGLVSLAQVVPLIVGALLGGSLADAIDRRKLVLVGQSLTALSSAGLAINSIGRPALWPLYVMPAVAAGTIAAAESGQSAMVRNLVRRSEMASTNALFQALFQLGVVVGPAIAGLLLAGAGVRIVYWIDVAGMAGAICTTFLIGPQRPPASSKHTPGFRSIVEGFGYLRGQQVLKGAYLIDINAMVFGAPRALFPALAVTVFGGGARTLGFLYAAPGAGALLGAAMTGWVHRVRRQGRAVIIAVLVWGVAITCFGLVRWLPAVLMLPAALVLLAVAGYADVISAVFRNTIIQLAAPEELVGRLMGTQMAAVTGGPRVGDTESGAVAAAFGVTASVVSGGLACIAGALLLAWKLPEFSRYTAVTEPEPSASEAVTGSPAPDRVA